ncbi:MAG: peptidylprolyl isomerase [Pseudomonadota bacterium]
MPMRNTLLLLAILLTVSISPFAVAADPSAKAVENNPVAVIATSMGDITVELFADAAPKTVANFVGLADGTKPFKDPNTGEMLQRPYYDGLVFHRVIKNFMLQGGDILGTGTGGPGYVFEDEIDGTGLGLNIISAMDPKTGPHPWLGIRSQQDFQQQILIPLLNQMGIHNQAELDARREEVDQKLRILTLMEAFENMGYKYNAKGSAHKPVRGALAMANAGPNTNGSQFFINLIDTDWLTGKHTVFGKVIAGMDVVDAIGKVPVDAGSKPLTPVVIKSIRLKDERDQKPAS